MRWQCLVLSLLIDKRVMDLRLRLEIIVRLVNINETALSPSTIETDVDISAQLDLRPYGYRFKVITDFE